MKFNPLISEKKRKKELEGFWMFDTNLNISVVSCLSFMDGENHSLPENKKSLTN